MGLFKKYPKPNGRPEGGALAGQFEADMPATAFQQAREEFFASVGQPVVDRARYFVIIAVLMGILAVMAVAIVRMVPLKTTEPYVLIVNDANGQVAKSAGEVRRAVDYTPERPVIERELMQFVARLYAINADYSKVVEDGHVAAYAYTRGLAVNEFKAFMDTEQPYQRQKTTKGLMRTVSRNTISFKEDGKLVLIRFRTSERSEDRPAPVVRDWVMTMQFLRDQPTTPQELDLNPLGIYVTHFEVVEER